jgi:hypothetical protein
MDDEAGEKIGVGCAVGIGSRGREGKGRTACSLQGYSNSQHENGG